MKNVVFKGDSLKLCLEIASTELNINKDKLIYKVIDTKKGLFKRSVTISVEVEESDKIITNNGTVQVKVGVIIVKNPIEQGRQAVIVPSPRMSVILNGVEVKAAQEVNESSVIEVVFEENEAGRAMDVNISPDKMEAFITIKYIPKVIFGLKDMGESNYLTLQIEKKDEQYAPLYNIGEIKEELRKMGIVYGIIDENIKNCAESRGCMDIIIAKGLKTIDDKDDILEIKFQRAETEGFMEDEYGSVDYKNKGSVAAVAKGEVIAVKVSGNEGRDGINIFADKLGKKQRKVFKLRVGDGCILIDDNTVQSVIEGKPCIKNSVFNVYATHEVLRDVDLGTGNIKFVGDIKVFGNVKEGMLLDAGNSIVVDKNVESAKLISKGNITVKGNIIMSTIVAGGNDVVIFKFLKCLNDMRDLLNSLMETIMEIKKYNLLGQKTTDGEMIKVLIENKFKSITKLCWSIISISQEFDKSTQDELVGIIREKLIGMGVLKIKHFTEIDEIVNIINPKIQKLELLLSLPVDVNIGYCQDSTIDSSGDIYVNDKGIYISNLIAHGGIYFKNEKGVARGGSIQAKKEIKCRIVGSAGGVMTKLIVDAKGHIWTDVAMQNTHIVVGGREFTIEVPSKNVHAYIDHKGDFKIDRISL